MDDVGVTATGVGVGAARIVVVIGIGARHVDVGAIQEPAHFKVEMGVNTVVLARCAPSVALVEHRTNLLA